MPFDLPPTSLTSSINIAVEPHPLPIAAKRVNYLIIANQEEIRPCSSVTAKPIA